MLINICFFVFGVGVGYYLSKYKTIYHNSRDKIKEYLDKNIQTETLRYKLIKIDDKNDNISVEEDYIKIDD